MDRIKNKEYYSSIIKENCMSRYPDSILPYFPWFMKICNDEKTKIFLAQILQDSEYSIDKFSDLAGKALEKIYQKKKAEESNLESLSQESATIKNTIKVYSSNSKTKATIKLIDYKSEYENISVTLQLGGEVKNLEKDEFLESYISIKNSVFLSIYTQTLDSPVKLDEIQLSLLNLISTSGYQDLINQPVTSVVTELGGEACRFQLELTLFLSEFDKKEILTQRLKEIDDLYLKEQENILLYNSLTGLLEITEDQVVPKQFSNKNKDRNCCGDCLVF